ncbi:sensor histidine kinase [Clostridiales bacterium COT073_COT-073]|nr:sensor histidine kinase [Clostridiales bacterium COT073_COT-073]
MKYFIYIAIWLLSSGLVYYWGKRHTRRRVEEIIQLIQQMRNQDYSIPMKQDDFSVLEDHIYKLFIELVEERERTRQSAKSQIDYLEDIAHQIKTPITNMLLRTETMQDLNQKTQELPLLKKQLQRLNSLADILLKLSSLDAKTDDMKKSEFELAELIDYALEIAEIPDRIEVVVDYSLIGKTIKGDFYWLSEAVINLLKNAGNLAKCTKIKIKADSNPLYTSLHIIDNGGGIAKEDIHKIFRRFYKTPDSKGFGIGLAMAKSIVERNHGTIEVMNVENGAEFQIKFYNVTE